MLTRILILDDEQGVRRLLFDALSRSTSIVDSAEDVGTGLKKLQSKTYDILVLDIRLPDGNGIDVLRHLRDSNQSPAVVVLTAYGDVPTAVEAMKLGADEFLLKPVSVDALLLVIDKILSRRRLREENGHLRERLATLNASETIIGKSKALSEVLALMSRISPLPTSVLIEGESGTGKELAARSIHAASTRTDGPFVAVNCGAIPSNLLENELFGHEKGAFTGADSRKIGYFEAAKRGTLFLDEIGEMSAELQVKLLRVLQEKTIRRIGGIEEVPVDARVISSTNRNLENEIKEGRFRKDLYYRINAITIHMPPLRARAEDIPSLAYWFLHRYAEAFRKNVDAIAPEVVEAFLRHRWEGNIRELENVVERAVALTDGRSIDLSDLPHTLLENAADSPREAPRQEMATFSSAREDFEREYLRRLLSFTGGNVSEAARVAAISRSKFYEKLNRYRIRHHDAK